MAQKLPKITQNSPKITQKWPQIAKMAQKWPKMGQKLAPAEKKNSTNWLARLACFCNSGLNILFFSCTTCFDRPILFCYY